MKRKPGKIVQFDGDRYGFVYADEQAEFIQYKKCLIREVVLLSPGHYERKVDGEGKKIVTLKAIDKVTVIGYID